MVAVAVGGDCKPVPVSPLESATDEQRARFDQAARRELWRQALHGNRQRDHV